MIKTQVKYLDPAKSFKVKKTCKLTQEDRKLWEGVVEEGNTGQSKRRARLIRDLKAATTLPAKQGSFKEFDNCTQAGINSNYTERHLKTSRYQ